MTLKDAAVLSTIIALVIWILQFFANAQYELIIANLGAWVFEALKTYLVNWAGTFASLAGLEQLLKSKKEETPK